MTSDSQLVTDAGLRVLAVMWLGIGFVLGVVVTMIFRKSK